MLTGQRTDICVIGSGVAGALIAHTCASQGLSVTVLEAGPRFDRAARHEQARRRRLGFDPWPMDPARNQFVNASAFAYPLNDYRLRAVGGSTLHWSGVAQRLRESDFETHTRYGIGVDWPLRYADLEPHYLRAEWELGVAGEPGIHGPPRGGAFPMPAFPEGHGDAVWRAAAARAGVSLERASYAKNNLVSHDGRPACATFATCTICPIGAQYSADWHVLKAEATGRCTVIPDAPVRRIEIDTDGSARVVHATRWEGGDIEVSARAVVVAAHAIESTRLLQLSGIGNPTHLGRHLMEHWEIHSRGLADERTAPFRVGFPTLKSYQWYDGTEREGRGAIGLTLHDQVDPLKRFGPTPGQWGRSLAQQDCDTFGRWRAIEAMTEHLPNSASRVDLDPEVRDPFGDPVPRFRFESSELDRRTQDAARAAIGELFDAAGLQQSEIAAEPFGAAHHMGTCRMSHRPEDGVVDPNGLVHGTDNLYLAGSAVFPTGGAVTPTLTIAALALRLADHLVTVHRGGGAT